MASLGVQHSITNSRSTMPSLRNLVNDMIKTCCFLLHVDLMQIWRIYFGTPKNWPEFDRWMPKNQKWSWFCWCVQKCTNSNRNIYVLFKVFIKYFPKRTRTTDSGICVSSIHCGFLILTLIQLLTMILVVCMYVPESALVTVQKDVTVNQRDVRGSRVSLWTRNRCSYREKRKTLGWECKHREFHLNLTRRCLVFLNIQLVLGEWDKNHSEMSEAWSRV